MKWILRTYPFRKYYYWRNTRKMEAVYREALRSADTKKYDIQGQEVTVYRFKK